MTAASSPYPFRIFAHRGASAELPENTLPAFARALELGCDALETDVHVSRDGVVVVHHDASGKRTAGVDRAIADTDFDEIRRWDVGRGLHTPTLDELLDACPGVRVNVDIKAHTKRATEIIVAKIVARGDQERVLVTSVDDAVTRHVRTLRYPGLVGLGRTAALLVLATPSAALRQVADAGMIPGHALQIPWKFKGVRFDKARSVKRGHAAGLRVDFWTVNDPDIARHIVAIGADGIMTDDPARVVTAVRDARARFGSTNQAPSTV